MSLDEKTRQELIEKRKQEIMKQELPDRLQMGAGIDVEKYRKFLLHDCPYTLRRRGAIGGGWSYTFEPTSLGTGLSIHCTCGYEENVSDYDNW